MHTGIQKHFRFIEADDKLVDHIYHHEKLLLVISRFGISLGFGDKTIRQICFEYELNCSLVLLIMNLYIDPMDNREELLHAECLPGLINYLKRAHQYYLEQKLPYIAELIDRFIENTANPHTKLLKSFFKGYEDEVREHMQYEDSEVFPYIISLYEANMHRPESIPVNFSINDFHDHHSDIEEKLEDLTQLLIKHFPPTKDSFYRNTILTELFALHYDLRDHKKIEDNILTPAVYQLEKRKRSNAH